MNTETRAEDPEVSKDEIGVAANLKQHKLLGFEHITTFDGDLREFQQAVDAALNKIGFAEVP